MAEGKRPPSLLTVLLRLHLQGLRRGAELARAVQRTLLHLQSRLRERLLRIEGTRGRGGRPVVGFTAFVLPPMLQDIAGTYAAIATVMAAETLRVAQDHAAALVDVLTEAQDIVPVQPLTDDDALAAALRTTPFPSAAQGNQPSALAAAWWSRQGEALALRVEDQVRAGLLAQESPTELARRVTGTPAQQGKDGVMAQALRSADVVAEAQTAMALTQAAEAVVAANAAAVAYLLHVSVLDERTSAECQRRDGKRYDPVTFAPIGHDMPYLSGPPYHMHCRSMIRLVLVGEEDDV